MTQKKQTSGWAVAVHTLYIDGIGEMLCLYAVAEPDKNSAIELITNRLGLLEGSRIGNAHPLSTSTIEMLGLVEGQVVNL